MRWCTPAGVGPQTCGELSSSSADVAALSRWHLLPHVDGRAESAMESEARLVMIDYKLPKPELQFEIHGRDGRCWRVDFAWPDRRVVAEYESLDRHVGPAEMTRDKKRFAALQEFGWTVVPIVADDIRRDADQFAARLAHHLRR
jgi:very-short-patch-repair endonuclease